jgi:hypothetical protein
MRSSPPWSSQICDKDKGERKREDFDGDFGDPMRAGDSPSRDRQWKLAELAKRMGECFREIIEVSGGREATITAKGEMVLVDVVHRTRYAFGKITFRPG